MVDRIQKEYDWKERLPETKMCLDGLKVLYNKTKPEKRRKRFLETFWKSGPNPWVISEEGLEEHFSGFDSKGFSIWFAEQSHHDNLDRFTAEEMLQEFFVRMEPFKKWSFGIMGLFEPRNTENVQQSSELKGLWIFRGVDSIPPVIVSGCSLVQRYRWSKANLRNRTHIRRINALLCNEDVEGMTPSILKSFCV